MSGWKWTVWSKWFLNAAKTCDYTTVLWRPRRSGEAAADPLPPMLTQKHLRGHFDSTFFSETQRQTTATLWHFVRKLKVNFKRLCSVKWKQDTDESTLSSEVLLDKKWTPAQTIVFNFRVKKTDSLINPGSLWDKSNLPRVESTCESETCPVICQRGQSETWLSSLGTDSAARLTKVTNATSKPEFSLSEFRAGAGGSGCKGCWAIIGLRVTVNALVRYWATELKERKDRKRNQLKERKERQRLEDFLWTSWTWAISISSSDIKNIFKQ